ncbi:hypothetical protein SAMN04487949_0903 [Halogranum gelatinilyticum]|uniref:AN1-type domain-containing protein n=1 Tax=Halogranum gelatinilyticum TaxID=660521 RepID=A0A1G9QK58_9EURY|nr:rhomboid family intramembrane serine protease [Halogranum gelatinilyticum]SDM11399.1 hypothetical protein SAMN04487949_0903 [Halogranum gelatinilyticum]
MAECDQCGRYENLPYQCRRCGQTFCAEHRLPENHSCPGLNEWNDPSGVFDSGFDDSVNKEGRAKGAVKRVTGTGGFFGYFRGNMTYLFLGLMWITFLLQYLVFPQLLGVGRNTELWASLFVLRPGNITYVWTWFTSVFAHGSFQHIAFNSIALYFFGPAVEQRLRSRKFAALFLGAGILAGLAQIGTGLVLGGTAGVLGASGAIMGVMGVLTVLNPNLKVYLYFIIPMPLWVLTFGFALLSLVAGFGSLNGGGFLGGNVAHIAHLAGLVIGLAYGSQIKGNQRAPQSLRFGGGGGPGGPGRGRF